MSVSVAIHDNDTGDMKAEYSGVVAGRDGLFVCIHLRCPHSGQTIEVFTRQSQSFRQIAETILKAADDLDAAKDKEWNDAKPRTDGAIAKFERGESS